MAARLLTLAEINRAARLANNISVACLGVSQGEPVNGARYQVSPQMQGMVWELIELLGIKAPRGSQGQGQQQNVDVEG